MSDAAPGSPSDIVEVVSADEASARDAWREMAVARCNPFLTPEWFSAWTASHSREAPYALGWYKGGELHGVLPLTITAKGPARILRFAGARRGDWFTPACREEDEHEMARACAAYLARNRRDWHVLQFHRIDESSAWPEALRQESSELRWTSEALRSDVLPYIEFGDGGFDAYMMDRSRNFRSQLRRRRRRLERDHGLRFRMTVDISRLDTDLESFFRLHDERWRDRGGSSSASSRTREHQSLFARAAFEQGWLRLWIADADDGPAAAWYGWRIGERYCYSLSGLETRFERYGLGNVLLAHTIEEAAREGAAIYDLMWGDEHYKRRFETSRRRAFSWAVGRPRHVAGPAVNLAGWAYRRARGLKANR